MNKRALVIGITGQDGSYLAELLLAKGYEVGGLVRRSSTGAYERIAHIQDRLHLMPGDLHSATTVKDAIRAFEPDELYNLGALSVVQSSFEHAELTGDVTGLGVTRVLDAVRHISPQTRVYQASTSEMFGRVQEAPQTEVTPFHPRSPYGVAKVYGHWMIVNYREVHGLHASSGITFNHESPRRGLDFVTRKISHTVAQIAMGKDVELRLGNLDARRDWGFAGDYVDAMWRMLQLDDPEDFVLATGNTHSVRDFCAAAFSHVNLSYEDHVIIDADFYRPAEEHQLVGDPSKAKQLLDWEATMAFEELVQLMVEADLALLQGKLRSLQ